jgi:hypothetical protein
MSEFDNDEKTPTIAPHAVKVPANRELAMAVADLVLEARAHTVGLRTLYEEVCEMEHAMPKTWGIKLIEAYERHAERTEQQIVSLRAVIA